MVAVQLNVEYRRKTASILSKAKKESMGLENLSWQAPVGLKKFLEVSGQEIARRTEKQEQGNLSQVQVYI